MGVFLCTANPRELGFDFILSQPRPLYRKSPTSADVLPGFFLHELSQGSFRAFFYSILTEVEASCCPLPNTPSLGKSSPLSFLPSSTLPKEQACSHPNTVVNESVHLLAALPQQNRYVPAKLHGMGTGFSTSTRQADMCFSPRKEGRGARPRIGKRRK